MDDISFLNSSILPTTLIAISKDGRNVSFSKKVLFLFYLSFFVCTSLLIFSLRIVFSSEK